jgi:dCTP deaminase
LREAIRREWIRDVNDASQRLQPASLDLTLGKTAYRLLCSFLPDRDSSVEQKLESYALEEFSIVEGALLEKNRAYLIPLVEQLHLPESVRGRTNPKSSTGRLDLFTRVLSDRNARFDEIPPGYAGRMFLEVVPRSFLVRVESGLSLNQLRLLTGDPGAARLSDHDLSLRHFAQPLVMSSGEPVGATDLDLSEGMFLSVDLSPDEHDQVGYRAKRTSRVVDLAATAAYRWTEFWEPVALEEEGKIILEPDDFHLLLSKEAVRVPATLAAEMSAYDPTAGELRTHYAGFFDPGFGETGGAGSRATLEVRARDVPFVVEDGQRLCKLVFENLLGRTELAYGPDIGSTYQGQEVTLSKHFRVASRDGEPMTEPESNRPRRVIGGLRNRLLPGR